MSFGKQTDVHNHLSTKHPLFSHRAVEDDAQETIVEPLHIESRFAEGAPPAEMEDPEEVQSHR